MVAFDIFHVEKICRTKVSRRFPPPFLHGSRRSHVKLGAERKCGPKRPRMTHDKRGTRPTGRTSVHCDPGTFSQKGARRSEICTVRPHATFKEKKKMQQNITNCQFSSSTHVLQCRVLLLSLGNQGSAQTPNHYESSRFLLYGALKIMTSSLISI